MVDVIKIDGSPHLYECAENKDIADILNYLTERNNAGEVTAIIVGYVSPKTGGGKAYYLENTIDAGSLIGALEFSKASFIAEMTSHGDSEESSSES